MSKQSSKTYIQMLAGDRFNTHLSLHADVTAPLVSKDDWEVPIGPQGCISTRGGSVTIRETWAQLLWAGTIAELCRLWSHRRQVCKQAPGMPDSGPSTHAGCVLGHGVFQAGWASGSCTSLHKAKRTWSKAHPRVPGSPPWLLSIHLLRQTLDGGGPVPQTAQRGPSPTPWQGGLLNNGNSRHQVQRNEDYQLGVILKENVPNIVDSHFIPIWECCTLP